MHPLKARYVAACQQLLVLVAVGVALVPAVGVVTLDVVHDGTGAPVRHAVVSGGSDAGVSAGESTVRSPAPPLRSHRAGPHRPR